MGGNIIKKRIRFEGRGKSGSGRTILCYQQNERAIFIHGFAKNDKASLSSKELIAFKALAKVLLNLSENELDIAIQNNDFIEVL